MRAYAYMHGAPLPETGSFPEEVLAESILRERNLQLAGVSLIARLIARIGGMADKELLHYLDMYKEELFQLRYNSRYVSATERWKMKIRKEAEKNAQIFERLERMTVKD